MPQWVMRGEGGSGKRPQGGSYSCHSNRSLTRICKEEDAAAAADGDEEKRLGIYSDEAKQWGSRFGVGSREWGLSRSETVLATCL